MHGGTVGVKSQGLGQGSVFSVRLPHSARPVENNYPSTATHSGLKSPEAIRILIVDDNADGARSLALVLSASGNNVRTAHDGVQALAVAREFRPEIVLLDIGLPGMNGYEVARNLRRMPELSHPVLVAVTGWGSEEDRRRTREAGFDHHLTKPVEMNDLVSLIAGIKAPADEKA